VLYSDVAHKRGRHVGPSDLPLLTQALAGAVASEFATLSDEQHAGLRPHYERALDVYVPVVLGGRIVGAYGVHQGLAPVRSARPLVLVTIGAVFGTLFYLGIRAAAAAQRRREPRPPRVGRTAAEPPRVSLSARADWKSLTPRELEVLRLMATSHTYHEMATRLSISEETIRSHVKRILHKLGQPDRTQAVVAALRAGVLQLS
jgi:DNA-binding CsgD family transcriptional regulator